MLKLYNTLSRKIQPFKPASAKLAKMYICGPTPYNYAHIGNLRTYVFEDLLRRYLLFKGYKLKEVMNLTDVDDKTIRGSKKAGVKLGEYTQKYIDVFFQDCSALNIQQPEVVCKATEHISQMVALVQKLIKKGVAYRGEDGSIYYSIGKFPNYGKLSHLDLAGLKAGARVDVDEYEKQNLADFALWKSWSEEDGEVFWETPLGKGRPGWHIECSAMSTEYLGSTFDIHCGGVDLIFPHHENEIAQSEAATGKKFAKYWIHGEHLLVDGKRMGKRFHNFYTLPGIRAKGYKPLALRYLYLSSHYRQQLNLTFEALEAAQNTLEKLQIFLENFKDGMKKGVPNRYIKDKIDATLQEFEAAMDDDLNTPLALSILHGFVNSMYVAKGAEHLLLPQDRFAIVQALKRFDSVFAFFNWQEDKVDSEKEKLVTSLVNQREKLRREKKFSYADKIRRQLEEMGIVLEDTVQGPKWRKA